MGESALLLLRMVGSLVVVAVLLWMLTKLARSRGLGAPGQELIDVRAQRGLSRNASLILVQVGAKHLLLGVADGGVRVLSEGEDLVATAAATPDADSIFDDGRAAASAVPARAPNPGPATSVALLDRLRDRTVRKQR